MDFKPIIEYLQAIPQISFAYIFGSVNTPYYIPHKSDIDLAILGDRPFEFLELNQFSEDISTLLPDHPEIDLIDLTTDAPVLIHEILAKGKPLFIRDTLRHDAFFSTQWSRYIDHIHWASQFDEDLKKGILTQHPIS
jgi:predicted nucleotidyltransferase